MVYINKISFLFKLTLVGEWASMKKQFILIPLCIVVILSFVGCTNGTKEATKKEVKNTAIAETNTVTNNASSDSSTSTSSSSNTESNVDGLSKVTGEQQNTELQYEKGKYKEVDEAFAIVKDYYLNGIDAVSSKIVSAEFDGSKDEAYKWSAVALTDKEKKSLDLNYQSILNQTNSKIKDITINNYKWSSPVGGTPKYIIAIQFALTITNDKGDSYAISDYMEIIKNSTELKFHLCP